MREDIDNWLKSLGIRDFDDLRSDEKGSYFKLLDLAEHSKISLDDVKKSIKDSRTSVEFALASHKLSKNEDLFLKARLKNYILLESLFDRPERAKAMLNQYVKVRKTGGEV